MSVLFFSYLFPSKRENTQLFFGFNRLFVKVSRPTARPILPVTHEKLLNYYSTLEPDYSDASLRWQKGAEAPLFLEAFFLYLAPDAEQLACEGAG